VCGSEKKPSGAKLNEAKEKAEWGLEKTPSGAKPSEAKGKSRVGLREKAE